MTPIPPTRQDRSSETLRRILESAEELLKERDFVDLTMSELAEHAGCAVGTLYGRIQSKETLLACLYERSKENSRAAVGSMLDALTDSDLEETVDTICAVTIKIMKSNRGVTKAVTDHLFSRAGENSHEFRRDMTQLFKETVNFLASKVKNGNSRAVKRACEVGLLSLSCVAQYRIVYGKWAGVQIPLSNEQLRKEMSTLLLSYLRAASSKTTGKGPRSR